MKDLFYSATRQNQGRYFISAGDDNQSSQPCEKSGPILSKRIGHNISSNHIFPSAAHSKVNRLYTAENDTQIITAVASELQRRLFKNMSVDDIYNAAKRMSTLNGWLIKADIEVLNENKSK